MEVKPVLGTPTLLKNYFSNQGTNLELDSENPGPWKTVITLVHETILMAGVSF